LAVALLAVAACDDAATSVPADFRVRFLVSNALLSPVTVAVDGTAYFGLTSGKSSGLTASSTAEWLTWTSAKPTDSNGVPIPDDIGEVRIPMSGIGSVLNITNVIGDHTYVTASIFNRTRARVSVGVYDGSSVSCASVLPAASDSLAGFTQIGYYRLLPATEVRAYSDGSRCTGRYVAWPQSQLVGFAPNSGLLVLILDSAP
jgi:hypothetical protein